MNDWLTWELLGTFAGTCLIVNIITQIFKYVFPNASATVIRVFALIMSEALTVLVSVIVNGAGWENILLSVLNGLLVSANLTIVKTHDIIYYDRTACTS